MQSGCAGGARLIRPGPTERCRGGWRIVRDVRLLRAPSGAGRPELRPAALCRAGDGRHVASCSVNLVGRGPCMDRGAVFEPGAAGDRRRL